MVEIGIKPAPGYQESNFKKVVLILCGFNTMRTVSGEAEVASSSIIKTLSHPCPEKKSETKPDFHVICN